MTEQNIEYNKISDYKGLEVLCNVNLRNLKYKSDLIILFVHHILTEQGFDCVVEINSNAVYEPASYKIVDSLPTNWNKLTNCYKLFYKKDDQMKIVSGRKKNDSFVLYLLKKDYNRDQISSPLSLKDYIPDEFFDESHSQYLDLKSINNVSKVMNFMTKTILGNPKYEFKKLHDAGYGTHTRPKERQVNEKEIPNMGNDHTGDPNQFGS